MTLAVTVLQTLSAFVIFVAGYLTLLVATVCMLVLATCVYKGGRLIKAYMVRIASQSLLEKGQHQRTVVQQ